MKVIRTKDNSLTVYNEDYKECYRALDGALTESFNKFILPCKIKDNFKILDICFGLGYNIACSLSVAKNLKIISLEKEIPLIIQTLEVPKKIEKEYEILRKLAKELVHKDDSFNIKIILGNATETIKSVNEKFDAIFLDPFSLRKNPELWQVSFLKELKRRIKDKGILSTYSTAVPVRSSLIEAGFKIGSLGNDFRGTTASISADLPPLKEKELKLLKVFYNPLY